MPTGTANRRATKVVINVPAMRLKAPNLKSVLDQSVLVKNPRPAAFQPGID